MVERRLLIELVEQGQMEILRFAGTLSEQERSLSGTAEKWGPRDILTHMAFWKQHHASQIAAARTGTNIESDIGYQQTNETVFDQYRDAPWELIDELVIRSHDALLEQLYLLSEDEINIPGQFPGQGNRPLWRRIAGNAFSHPLSHIGPVYLERGERAYADEMRGREEMLVTALDDSPDWQAECRYNLACHWALCGDSSKALDLLEFALMNNPGLVDWAPQDSDLVSLHGNSEFIDLLKRARALEKTS